MRRIDRKTKATASGVKAITQSSFGWLVPPMPLLRTDSLSDSRQWIYELKLDGYRSR